VAVPQRAKKFSPRKFLQPPAKEGLDREKNEQRTRRSSLEMCQQKPSRRNILAARELMFTGRNFMPATRRVLRALRGNGGSRRGKMHRLTPPIFAPPHAPSQRV
jgi:hypothetical protein